MENIIAKQEEISLKELIKVLWKDKILIAVITIAALILTAIYAFVIATPSYQSSALFTLSLQTTITTPYGEYILPFTGIDGYTSLIKSEEALIRTADKLGSGTSVNQLKNSISVQNTGKNTFTLVAAASSPEQAKEIVSIHSESYLTHFQKTLAAMAIGHFSNLIDAQIVIDTNEIQGIDMDLEKALDLLEKTDKVIAYGKAVEINPAYRILLERVTELQIKRSTLERRIEQAALSLDVLTAERESLTTKDYTNGNLSKYLSSLVVLTGQEGARKVSRSPSTLLVVGLVMGLAVGIFISLFKAYWKEQLS